ncbi:PREDICTED: dnaJ homolog subfamily C member 28 [Brassica oleracea var. oleracea]|uniref:DnaJ homologue subfamily C member 28 conserved domain-containing protein n=1 Tax=Brassica oleracea var. oleracea TaxID=109376 RepID=A0A0D3AZK7_BRAOL|nr:PREDICTED: dnaJ homolog subfamily C member 28 [Brassica oleracea var. oleracea]XP_013629470.1 PREDICTED: dnaJ homolog subfamily C member 28 [Brassica oleracea var. oleracea]
MAVRLARSSVASSPSRPSLISIVNRISDFASYSSSSSWWSSPEDLTAGSKRREKKTTDRFSAAIDAVHDRKLPPELRGRRDFVRSETDIINVVEQRIWHSMEEGQFENLPGKGKPLNLHTNPHADPAEDTLYRILNKNGFAPEWVELNKDIRSKAKEWRVSLKKAWAMKLEDDQSGWEERSDLLKTQLKQINNMVFRYNLIVPFGRQMFGLKWEKEIDHLKE